MQEVQRLRIDQRFNNWRVGPGAITKDHLYVVGLVHVSAGTWQPSTFTKPTALPFLTYFTVLQLKGHIIY